MIDWYLKVREGPNEGPQELAWRRGLYQAHGIVTSCPSPAQSQGKKGGQVGGVHVPVAEQVSCQTGGYPELPAICTWGPLSRSLCSSSGPRRTQAVCPSPSWAPAHTQLRQDKGELGTRLRDPEHTAQGGYGKTCTPTLVCHGPEHPTRLLRVCFQPPRGGHLGAMAAAAQLSVCT